MNLDNLINEADFSWLSKHMKSPSSSERSMNAFEYEEARQKSLEQQIEQAKKRGDTEKVKALEKKLNGTNLGGADKKSTSDKRGTDKAEKIQLINNVKGKLCFLMMNYANLASGVGLSGDTKLSKDIKVVKGKKDEDGDQVEKVVGAPSRETLMKHWTALKNAAQLLYNHEYGYNGKGEKITGAPRRYFEANMQRGKELLKIVDEIHPDELSFDPNTRSVPFKTSIDGLRTGKPTGRMLKDSEGREYPEHYAEISPLKFNRKGEMTTQLHRTKMATVLGKKRFNAFVFQELQPYIHEFQKYRKDWNTVRPLDVKDAGDIDSILKNIKKGIEMDVVSKDVEDHLDLRSKKAKEALNGQKFSDYKKFRKNEQQIGKIASAKNERDSEGKIDGASYKAQNYAGKLALRNIYASKGKSGNQGWLETHHIAKLNLTKLKKLLNAWIADGVEPNGQIKFFGSMPGSSGSSGAGTLIFLKDDSIPTEPEQFTYNGLFAYKAGKSILNGDLTSNQMKYFENHAGKQKDDWKNGVLNALKKYDTPGNATVMTEEESYFNY